MPTGLYGKTAENFFGGTNAALERAAQAHGKEPFEGRRQGAVPHPQFPYRGNVAAPFTKEDAWTGGPQQRNVGNSSNIVINPEIYRAVAGRVEELDNQAGREIYEITMAVEDICSRIFIVPEIVPRLLSVTERFKYCMGKFRSVTEELTLCMKGYVGEISAVDHDTTRGIAISVQGTNRATTQVAAARDRQIALMGGTADGYGRQANNLQHQAARARQQAVTTQNQITALTPTPTTT